MKTKEINYAYPSSTMATKLCYAKTGCYYVTVGDTWDEFDSRKVVFASKDKGACWEVMKTIDMPIGAYSLN